MKRQAVETTTTTTTPASTTACICPSTSTTTTTDGSSTTTTTFTEGSFLIVQNVCLLEKYDEQFLSFIDENLLHFGIIPNFFAIYRLQENLYKTFPL